MGAPKPHHPPGSVGEPAGSNLSNLLNFLLIHGRAQQELHARVEYIKDRHYGWYTLLEDSHDEIF